MQLITVINLINFPFNLLPPIFSSTSHYACPNAHQLSASIKESIRKTASDLLIELPAFSRRLAQREYFLLFASKIKRRLLLKMYTIS